MKKMKTNKKLIYIASPYTNSDNSIRIQNYIEVTKIAADLVLEGHVAISPITYGHVLSECKEMPTDWVFWMDFCLVLLAKCDKILVCNTISGWENSKGVAAEIKFAKQKGIKVEYLKPLE